MKLLTKQVLKATGTVAILATVSLPSMAIAKAPPAAAAKSVQKVSIPEANHGSRVRPAPSDRSRRGRVVAAKADRNQVQKALRSNKGPGPALRSSTSRTATASATVPYHTFHYGGCFANYPYAGLYNIQIFAPQYATQRGTNLSVVDGVGGWLGNQDVYWRPMIAYWDGYRWRTLMGNQTWRSRNGSPNPWTQWPTPAGGGIWDQMPEHYFGVPRGPYWVGQQIIWGSQASSAGYLPGLTLNEWKFQIRCG